MTLPVTDGDINVTNNVCKLCVIDRELLTLVTNEPQHPVSSGKKSGGAVKRCQAQKQLALWSA